MNNESSTASADRESQATREGEIARRAYELWEQEGRPEGREQEHWLQAEKELTGRRIPQPESFATAPTSPIPDSTQAKIPSVIQEQMRAPSPVAAPADREAQARRPSSAKSKRGNAAR
jgi:hypothetical protein